MDGSNGVTCWWVHEVLKVLHCQPHKISVEHELFEEGPCMSVKVQFSDICCFGILNLGNDVIYLCTSLIIVSLLD